jgi:hypothetical protein
MARKTISFDAAVPVAELAESRLRLGWRVLLTLLLLLLVALLSILLKPAQAASAAPLPRAVAQSTSAPLVVAFYYAWYDENSWSYDQLSDLPATTYASRDRGAMGRHIDQAKAAGIDAFLVAWYGPGGDTNQTEANLAAMLEEAAARDFKIGILFETDSPFMGGADAIGAGLQHALSVHANHPAFLRADGKPVIFFWRPGIYGSGTWSALRSQVDPGYGSLWIAEGVDTSLLSVFDGHYLYSNTWNPPANLTTTNQKFARLVDGMRQSTGAPKLWVATVMPGYDDVRVRPNGGFARGREGGGYYAQSWQAAIASAPNWVVITSFNEWPEGTYIEPSVAFGDQYLGLTANWSGQFKAGGGAPAAAVPAPEPEAPTAYVATALLNLRAGPDTRHALLGTVAEGTALAITGKPEDGANWWRVESDAGVAWVFGELVRAAGPLDGVPAVAPLPLPIEVAPAGAEIAVLPASADASTPSINLTVGDRIINLRSVRSAQP